jgi:hypothetical protein
MEHYKEIQLLREYQAEAKARRAFNQDVRDYRWLASNSTMWTSHELPWEQRVHWHRILLLRTNYESMKPEETANFMGSFLKGHLFPT